MEGGRNEFDVPAALFLHSTPFFAPCGGPAFAIERVIGDSIFFPKTNKKMIPNGAWNYNNKPIQVAKKEALYRVSIFVCSKAAALFCALEAEEYEDPQRQSTVISRQIGHNTVAIFLATRSLAAEKYQQTCEVDRKSPGELNQIEQHPGPANGSDCPVHVRSLFHFRRFGRHDLSYHNLSMKARKMCVR